MKKLIILIIPILLTGCYNYRELNDLAIIAGVGIDKVDNEYLLTVQVIDTNKIGSDTTSSGEYPKTIIYEKTGKTIQEAFRLMILECPKRIYAEHNELLLLSEDIAKNDLSKIIDLFYRDPESRKEYQVAIVKNISANKVLKTLTPLDTVGSKNLVNSIDSNHQYLGYSTTRTFNDMLNMYLNPNVEITLPAFKMIDITEKDNTDNLKESESRNKIILDGIAVFKNNHLIGYLNHHESLTLNFTRNEVENTIINYTCDENDKKNISYEIINTKSNISPKKNKKEIDIEIKGNATISEINCDYDLTNPKDLKIIEENLNQKIKDLITNNINNINKTFHSDIYGFKDYFYKSNYKYYRTIKDNWNESIEEIKINIKSNINISEKGNGIKVITDEQEN